MQGKKFFLVRDEQFFFDRRKMNELFHAGFYFDFLL